MRREIFAGNWKMYKTGSEAESLISALKSGIKPKEGREFVIFPPAVYASAAVKLCAGSPISVGMQNMHFEEEGAFTGETSPAMVKDSGCKFILIGHSERRHVFHETDSDVNKKVKAAYRHSLIPMVCVGELLGEREKGLTEKVLRTQVLSAFDGVSEIDAAAAVIAYEPVWAIGTGRVATPEIAEEAHAFVRSLVKELYGQTVSDNMPILYGGSVKADNIAGLLQKPDIDGALVGGASLKADTFLPIANV